MTRLGHKRYYSKAELNRLPKPRPHNEWFAQEPGEQRLCATCHTLRPTGELNIEAISHHNAHKIECIDRKACERRKRKAK